MPWKTSGAKEQRWNFIQAAQGGKSSFSELCQRWGISRKTGYKWLARFEARGRRGLGDDSRAAHQVANRTSVTWLQRVRRWRHRHPYWGAPKLHWALRRRFGRVGLPAEATISRWLKVFGLTPPRRRRPHKGPRRRRPDLTEARRPNEVWTVDFKGWFRTGDGTRIEPLTVRDQASRYVLAITLLPQQNVQDCRKVFTQIFERYGLPLVIRADNGSPFGSGGALGLTRLSAWWVKLGIKMEFITPDRPGENAAHEQFHSVYQREAVSPPAQTLQGQKQKTERCRRRYNEERPHEALGMRVPAEVYYRSRRRLKPSAPWRYPRAWESRLVRGHGVICLAGQNRFVGEAFEGERVGLKRTKPGVWEVYYGPLLLGELAETERGGIRAIWYQRGKTFKR
jgi:putative transposase